MVPYISDEDVVNLAISPIQAMQWAKESFLIKNSALLPHKISIPFEGDHYFNTMPVVIPSLNAMGVKVVSRYPGRIPTIDAQILLYNYQTGNLIDILDAAKITEMRTGAVCALTVQTLAVKNFTTMSVIGLGRIGKYSMQCILEANKDRKFRIKLYRYKNQAESFVEYFKHYENATFEIIDDMRKFVEDADVVISCITNATGLLTQPEWFKKGVLLVPVHLKGFQNCDPVFEKIFGDDTSHISEFKYFNQYRYFAELADVLQNKLPGRENDSERIISYNVGLAIYDIVFAKHIVAMLNK